MKGEGKGPLAGRGGGGRCCLLLLLLLLLLLGGADKPYARKGGVELLGLTLIHKGHAKAPKAHARVCHSKKL